MGSVNLPGCQSSTVIRIISDKKKNVLQKRTERVQMYSGEASRFSADETNQKRM